MCVAVKRHYDKVHDGETILYFKLPDGTIKEIYDCWECGTGDFADLIEATGMKFDGRDALTLLNELYEQLPDECN